MKQRAAWTNFATNQAKVPHKPKAQPFEKPQRSHEEDDQQMVVIDWAILQRYKGRPLNQYIHHSPNGGRRVVKSKRDGTTYCPEGKRLKDMGTRPGFPDLQVIIPKMCFHGLFIEMKATNGTLSVSQKEYHPLLIEEGYKVVTCHSADAAIKTIKEYLALPAFERA